MIKPYKHCNKCGALIVNGELCEDCKPMTNADRIRQMTDEELAEFIDIYDIEDICRTRCAKTGEARERCMCYGEQCVNNILQWLKREVSEDAGTD
jgi:hypothetical protein